MHVKKVVGSEKFPVATGLLNVADRAYRPATSPFEKGRVREHDAL